MTMAKAWTAVVAVLAAFLALAAPAWAADKVTLRDGRVIEGTILREEQGYVWVRVGEGGLGSEEMFTPAQIASIDRGGEKDAEASEGAAPAKEPAASPKPAEGKPEAAEKPKRAGVPRAAVITLGGGGDKDMVGVYMTSHILKEIMPVLEKDQVDVVVFRINSGGGMLLEIQALSDIIHNEYKKRFRTVAWIESAISAAAMTAHTMEEVYFMTSGNYGAATGWRGALEAVKGRQLQEVLFMMEKISERGGHPKEIMRSMQIQEPLSASVDPQTGQVTWFNSLEGQSVLNPVGRVFTFTAADALRFKFARGVADDVETLGRLMGYTEVDWVGERVPGVPYPVSRAEKINREYRERVYKDERATTEYQVTYNDAMQRAQAAPIAERGVWLNRAGEALNRIRKMVENNPNFALTVLNITPDRFEEWYRERLEELDRLRRR